MQVFYIISALIFRYKGKLVLTYYISNILVVLHVWLVKLTKP